MDGQKTPVCPTVDTKQTRTPQKTRVPGMNPLSTFADPVASYLTAGDAWPNTPPAHRSLLLIQRTAGNRAVAQYLATGSRLNEPFENLELRANSISADKTPSEKAALIPSLAHEEGLEEVPLDREDESTLKNNNGDKAVSRTVASVDNLRSSAQRWGSSASG